MKDQIREIQELAAAAQELERLIASAKADLAGTMAKLKQKATSHVSEEWLEFIEPVTCTSSYLEFYVHSVQETHYWYYNS